MKNQIILFLAILVFYQSSFGSINIWFEINEIIEDFSIHKKKYDDDLNTFISKHFGDLRESHKDQHNKEHKHHNHPKQTEFEQNSNQVYVLNSEVVKVNESFNILNKKDNFFYKKILSTFEKQKVFQPPQYS